MNPFPSSSSSKTPQPQNIAHPLTAIPLVLPERTVHHAVAHQRLLQAKLAAAKDSTVRTLHTVLLVRLVAAVRVSVAAPIERNAALAVVALERRARWLLLATACRLHLLPADAHFRVRRVDQDVAVEIVGQIQTEHFEEEAATIGGFYMVMGMTTAAC